MKRKSALERAFRAWLRLPSWCRPAVAGGGLVLAILLPRLFRALPGFSSGRADLHDLVLTLGAGTGAGVLGGLVHGVTRPPLRRLGRVGDYLSGIAILWGYLGSLLLASPFVFERSAIPTDAEGWCLWGGLATVVGLAAAHMWFRGPESFDRLWEERSKPQLERLVSEQGDKTATLLSGCIRVEALPRVLGEVAAALGERLPANEPARIAAALAALPEDDEDGLDWSLALEPALRVHLVPDEALVSLDFLLEGEREPRARAVSDALAACTVDPLAA